MFLLPLLLIAVTKVRAFQTRPHSSRIRGHRRSLPPILGESVNADELPIFPELDSNFGMEPLDQHICVIDFDDVSNPYVSNLSSESTFVEFTSDGLILPAGPVGQFKEKLANALAEPIVELLVASAVLMNSLLVALSTLDSLDAYRPEIQSAEIFVSFLFSLDFAGRWFSSSKDPGRFVLNPQFALDVVVVLLPLVVSATPGIDWEETFVPSFLTTPSGLFNLQLLRVLQLRRVLRDLETFDKFSGRVLNMVGLQSMSARSKVQEWQLQLCRVLMSLFTLLSVATGLIYTAEHGVNEGISNYFDALYFGLSTLTTVGFGDVTPVTWRGKLIVSLSILAGVAIVPAQAASLVEALLEREDNKRRRGAPRKRTSSSRRVGGMAANGINDTGSQSDPMMGLDTAQVCSSCGATFHWTNAQYCYSCGAEL